eukprot:6188153-Pleurochrysis_carterae.AAC.1
MAYSFSKVAELNERYINVNFNIRAGKEYIIERSHDGGGGARRVAPPAPLATGLYGILCSILLSMAVNEFHGNFVLHYTKRIKLNNAYTVFFAFSVSLPCGDETNSF